MHVNSSESMTWTSPTETARFRAAMEEQQRQGLAKKVKDLRIYKGWTEAILARESGVSIETISRLENAKTENPRDHTISSLAAAFAMTSDELAGPRLSPEDMDRVTQTQLDRIEAKLNTLLDADNRSGERREKLSSNSEPER